MTGERRERRGAKRPARKPATGTYSTATPTRRSRASWYRYAFIFFIGLLIGRIASTSFPVGLREATDLLMVVGLALTIALAWRSWARGAAEARRREQLERRRAQARAESAEGEE